MAAMTAGSTEALEEARRAMAEGAWEQARTSFAAVLREQEHPEALDGFALASWFLGEIEEGVEMRQRAFAAYAAAGECDLAARVGVWISHQYLDSGRVSLANGTRAAQGMAGSRWSVRGAPAASRRPRRVLAGPWRSAARTVTTTSRSSRSA
jgi:hypothetical protein